MWTVEDYLQGKSWPFEEAKRIIDRIQKKPPSKGYVLFETGYGPSGLPHIGTFGEVFRTTIIRQALQRLSAVPTKLFAFSDDMDGLRKVPDNIPNQEIVAQHLGQPLTKIPDPFGTHESFGAHNNARLRTFLDAFGFDYDFKSATECYKSGMFDKTLLLFLEQHQEILNIMLPTLGPERRATYSPFLPLCPKTGKVLQVPMEEYRPKAGTVVYRDEDNQLTETPVTGGHCKLQWKPDWAMRWIALGVDYEMSGKDLIESVSIAQKILKVLKVEPPLGFSYELFLDQNGEKISKSKGNGISVDEWLSYATKESLALFMFHQPKRAKRLYFDVIPKTVDEYYQFRSAYKDQTPIQQIDNPVWHIHNGNPPALEVPITYGLLLNLASVCHAEDKSVLWGFIKNYVPGATPENSPDLDHLAAYAVQYYQDFVKPTKKYRLPDEKEKTAFQDLVDALKKLANDAPAEEIQTQIYTIGKNHQFEPLKNWFQALYEVLLGQSSGPRMGTFIKLYGIDKTLGLIDTALAGKLKA